MFYAAFPPEINSGRVYTGPGSEPLLAAAAAWDAVAAELQSTAAAFSSVIASLTSGPWIGPSSLAMAAAVAPYVTWMGATATQAAQAATQATAAATAYETAFAAHVPPVEIAANRAQLAMLVATNLFGQNTAAIAAAESQYAEMWAQDATAMDATPARRRPPAKSRQLPNHGKSSMLPGWPVKPQWWAKLPLPPRPPPCRTCWQLAPSPGYCSWVPTSAPAIPQRSPRC